MPLIRFIITNVGGAQDRTTWNVLAITSIMASSLDSGLPDLPEIPHHPSSTFVFPKRTFRQKKAVERSCQLSWFSKWKWLHYSEQDDALFCHVCISALKSKKMPMRRGESCFVSKGFQNWKDGTVAIKKHESTASHKEALQVTVVIPSCYQDIGELLSHQHADMKKR